MHQPLQSTELPHPACLTPNQFSSSWYQCLFTLKENLYALEIAMDRAVRGASDWQDARVFRLLLEHLTRCNQLLAEKICPTDETWEEQFELFPPLDK